MRSPFAPTPFLAGWLLVLAFQTPAFQKPNQPALPDIDRRPALRGPVAADTGPETPAAEARLRQRLPQLQIAYDPVTGAPRSLAARDGLLSGPNGEGRGIGAAARAIPADDPHRAVKAFLEEHRAVFGHGPEALAQARIKRQFTTPHNGLRTVLWEQQVDGIPIFEGGLIAHTTGRGELVSVSSGLLPDPTQAAKAGRGQPQNQPPLISPQQAIVSAARNLGENVAGDDIIPSGNAVPDPEKRRRFKAPPLKGETAVSLVWLPFSRSELRLCWDVILTSRSRGEMFRVLVEAQTGEVVLRRCLTHRLSDATYRVFTSDSPAPFSPGFSTPSTNQPPLVSRALVTLSALNTNASPLGWINDGDNETRGNNVDAHLDHNFDELPDLPRPRGAPFRVFDFPLDLTQGPDSYGDASVVQLFYWCNWMHDRLYELGFTEAAGNFQQDNFGRGGLGDDAIDADAQDGSGEDNAWISVPPDGLPAQMTMFIWTLPKPDRDSALDAAVVLHEYTHGLSCRLVGGGYGMSTSQAGGLGEGWSDFYSLALLSEPGDDPDAVYPTGAYLVAGPGEQNYYFGIRRYPYSTDLNKNPLTFKDIDPRQISEHVGVPRSPSHPFDSTYALEVHSQGEVWCVALWEARASLIRKHGAARGNQLILELVTDGLRLAPPNPQFLEARDAILLADQVDTGGANQMELWRAFARRGLGFSATSPESITTIGVREAFDLPDSLFLSPNREFAFRGPVGGPFAPSQCRFQLTTIGTNAIAWRCSPAQSWLTVTPAAGTLAPQAPAVEVVVELNAAATHLPPGIFANTLSFVDETTGRTQTRAVVLAVGQPDYFTEQFVAGDNDLAWQTFTFRPDGSASFYSVCRAPATRFPTDPVGGTYEYFYESRSMVTLAGGETISLYGLRTNTFFISTGGQIGFTFACCTAEAFTNHFAHPCVSALFDQWDIWRGRGVSWKQLSNRVAVTFLDMPESYKSGSNNFQAELFFDGRIRLTFLNLDAKDGLVGLSRGGGVPANFVPSDFSTYPLCPAPLAVSVPASANEGDAPVQGSVQLPAPMANPITVSLRSSDSSEATVPAGIVIPAGATNATFPITIVDDAALDGTQTAAITASAPGFEDGTAVFAVNDNEAAALAVELPPNLLEGQTATGLVRVSAAPAADVRVALVSSDVAVLLVPPEVVIPAGQTSAVFLATAPDDGAFDGGQTVNVVAAVANWTPGAASVNVADAAAPQLQVHLRAHLSEAAATATNGGWVEIPGTLSSNLTVQLQSSDPVALVVPPSVLIRVGESRAAFALTPVNNLLVDGPRAVTVTARADGWVEGSGQVAIEDDETPSPPSRPYPPHLATNVGGGVTLSWLCGSGPLVVNGGFELGRLDGWTITGTNSFWPVSSWGTQPAPGPESETEPFAGDWSVISGQTRPGWAALVQDVPIPATISTATLRWADRVRSRAADFGPRQVYRVELRDTNDAVREVLSQTRPGDTRLGDWGAHECDVSRYAGHTVRLAFFQENSEGFLNVFVDEVEVEAQSPGQPVFEVYLGTSPSLGAADFLGTTTNTAWRLSGLPAETTYYWQIVARLGAVRTPGPVWQFRTAPVGWMDHFDWTPIASPQWVGQPFQVTLAAKDFDGRLVTWFTNNVRLFGWQGPARHRVRLLSFVRFTDTNTMSTYGNTIQAIYDAFDDYEETRTVTTDPATLRNELAGQDVFLVPAQELGLDQMDSLGSAWAPVLCEFVSRGGLVVVCSYKGDEYRVLENSGLLSLAKLDTYYYTSVQKAADHLLVEGMGPGIGVYHVSSYATTNGLVLLTTTNHDAVVITRDYGLGHVVMIGTDYAAETEREVLLGQVMANSMLWAQGGDLVSVSITPDRTGSFTNGQWSGWITVQEPAAQMHLQAAEYGFASRANTITVLTSNDLALALAAAPNPAAIGGLITCTLTISVAGPDAAAGVVLTNWLPANAELAAVQLSQGESESAADMIISHLGTVTPEQPATVTLQLRALTVDPVLHRAEVSRAGAEPYAGNNTVSAITTIQRPSITVSSAAVEEGDEGTTNALFTVRLSVPSSQPVAVNFATTNGTALAGSDFVGANGTVTFPPGVLAQTVSVAVLGDTVAEADETFLLQLTSARNGIIMDRLGVGTILDDDGGTSAPRLSIRQAGDKVVLTWPTSADGFVLEHVGVLSGPMAWEPVTNAARLTPDGFVWTNALSGDSRFFRLRKP